MQMFDLSGQIAVVTGGSRGIGFGIAEGYARAGASVIIANRRPEMGQRAIEQLKQEGLTATSIPVDIRSVSSTAELASRVIRDFGRIDVLVNDAGITLRRPAEEVTEEDWDDVVDTNLKGCFFCCQAIAKEMIRRKKGKIINISSVHSNIVLPNMSVYAATKAGISHLTRALALEWGKHNIRVNCIGPGATMTDMNKPTWDAHPEYLEARVGGLPLGRIAYPQDYVGAAIFLASEASDYVTGVTLHVDGGLVLGRC